MSSIMRARSAPAGRGEEWEIIGGSSLELKVAGPSMLGIGCPDRHALPLTTPIENARTVIRTPPAKAGSFMGGNRTFASDLRTGQPAVRSTTKLRCKILAF